MIIIQMFAGPCSFFRAQQVLRCMVHVYLSLVVCEYTLHISRHKLQSYAYARPVI